MLFVLFLTDKQGVEKVETQYFSTFRIKYSFDFLSKQKDGLFRYSDITNFYLMDRILEELR